MRLTKENSADYALRERFELSEQIIRKPNYQTAIILSFLFTMLGVLLDIWVYPDYVLPFFFLRIITGAGLILAWLLLHYSNNHKLHTAGAYSAAILPSVCATAIMYLVNGGNSIYYGGLILVLVCSSMLLRWQFRDSLINSVACVSLYLILLALENFSKPDGFVHLFYIIATAVFASCGVLFTEKLRFKEFVLLEKLESSKKELEKQNLKMIELDRVKTSFFANISHELRTPLTLIMGPIETLTHKAAKWNDEQANEHLKLMKSNSLRLLRLVNEVLDLIKLDLSEYPVNKSPTAVNQFCEDIINSVEILAQKKRIKVNFTGSPELKAWVDRRSIEKIILNLLMNAVKFTPAGGEINFSLNYNLDGILLEVSDNGEGMKSEDIPMVFERFWQADMSAKRKHGGAGLGLALVKNLVDTMDGEIDLQSTIDKGTTFNIFIPATFCPELELVADDNTKMDIVEDFNTQARLVNRMESHTIEPSATIDFYNDGRAASKKHTILIVDDEPDLRSFISGELSEYDILTASDGAEGWEKAKQYLPDLIVLDLEMPRKDGLEVTSLLRAHPSTERIPIILVTAKADEVNKLEALNLGVNDFLSKPFSSAELHTRVDNLIMNYLFEVELRKNNARLEKALEKIKEQEATVVKAEKVSSLAVMSAGIVHEVNNPLNYVRTALHALKTFEDDITEDEKEDFKETVGDASEGLDRVIRIITDLRALTHGDSYSAYNEVSADRIYETACKLSGNKLDGTKIEVDIQDDLFILGNELQLGQVLSNMLINASLATKEQDREGLIKIQMIGDQGKGIKISITDNGVGIDEEELDKIFDPFFTKRDVGEGMGLGLSICQKIIHSHKGLISCDSEKGEWTSFTIQLPEASIDD
ncbi:MAG: ATP-binding protein [Akkermansiaceae bacterium]